MFYMTQYDALHFIDVEKSIRDKEITSVEIEQDISLYNVHPDTGKIYKLFYQNPGNRLRFPDGQELIVPKINEGEFYMTMTSIENYLLVAGSTVKSFRLCSVISVFNIQKKCLVNNLTYPSSKPNEDPCQNCIWSLTPIKRPKSYYLIVQFGNRDIDLIELSLDGCSFAPVTSPGGTRKHIFGTRPSSLGNIVGTVLLSERELLVYGKMAPVVMRF